MEVQSQTPVFRPCRGGRRFRGHGTVAAVAFLLVGAGGVTLSTLSPPKPVLDTTIAANAVATPGGDIEQVTMHIVDRNGGSGPLNFGLVRGGREVEIASVTSDTCHVSADRVAVECPGMELGSTFDVTLTYQRPGTGLGVAVYFDANGSDVPATFMRRRSPSEVGLRDPGAPTSRGSRTWLCPSDVRSRMSPSRRADDG
jgi:hypothetical protein